MIFNMIAKGKGSVQGSVTPKDINFIDYDGTVVASYTTSEWDNVLPDNPQHEGLISQGWNYTVAQINERVSATGSCVIGQLYMTESGSTEIDIEVVRGRLSPSVGLAPNGSVQIDWGDGSTSSMSGTSYTTVVTRSHTYSRAGRYTIKINVTSGTCAIYSNTSDKTKLVWGELNTLADTVYRSSVKDIRLGANIVLGNFAFAAMYSLRTITFNDTVTSNGGQSAFYFCYSLQSMTMPDTLASISTSLMFRECESLKSVALSPLLTEFSNAVFERCYSLHLLSIPPTLTRLYDSVFRLCYSLTNIYIPEGVTSISSYALYGVSAMGYLVIPENVTNIYSQAFAYSYGLAEIHVKPTTPPSLSSNVFQSIPNTMKIYVPSASLSAYQSATNWSTYASQMVGE